jgi:hypothetical protein
MFAFLKRAAVVAIALLVIDTVWTGLKTTVVQT